MNSNFISDWWYRWSKGKLLSYVARGRESGGRDIKAVKTALIKRHISTEQVRTMLGEIEEESVKPFSRPPLHIADRQPRLDHLRRVFE
jgi:hypothetical protein